MMPTPRQNVFTLSIPSLLTIRLKGHTVWLTQHPDRKRSRSPRCDEPMPDRRFPRPGLSKSRILPFSVISVPSEVIDNVKICECTTAQEFSVDAPSIEYCSAAKFRWCREWKLSTSELFNGSYAASRLKINSIPWEPLQITGSYTLFFVRFLIFP